MGEQTFPHVSSRVAPRMVLWNSGRPKPISIRGSLSRELELFKRRAHLERVRGGVIANQGRNDDSGQTGSRLQEAANKEAQRESRDEGGLRKNEHDSRPMEGSG